MEDILCFQSSKHPVLGFTRDASGTRLPSQYGPWRLIETSPDAVPLRSLLQVGIEREGYYLWFNGG